MWMHVCMYVYVDICMYVCIYVRMCVYTYAYIVACTYAHTPLLLRNVLSYYINCY